MNPHPTEPGPWRPPYPQTWAQVYRDIAALLVGFLAVAYLLDWLKRGLAQ